MTSTFRHELKHWSVHATFCTLPSFVLACFYGGYSRLPSILGILLAIATTILVFALISSSSMFQSHNKDGLLRRSIALGAKIRSGISAVGLVGVAIPPAAFFLAFPDMMAGIAAIGITYGMFHLISAPLSGEPFDRNTRTGDHLWDEFWMGSYNSLIPTYITTLIEGLIITLTLLAISAVVSLVLRMKRKHAINSKPLEA